MAFSSAPDLPALFRAGSAPGVRPSELCSSRAAARRLRRRCPLVVGTVRRRTRAAIGRRERRSAAPNRRRPMWARRRAAPRLQGFAPRESPPPRPGCLDRSVARSSHGVSPLQGVPPHRTGAAFTAPPLMRFPLGRERPCGPSSGSYYPARLARPSRDRRPSWGFATS